MAHCFSYRNQSTPVDAQNANVSKDRIVTTAETSFNEGVTPNSNAPTVVCPMSPNPQAFFQPEQIELSGYQILQESVGGDVSNSNVPPLDPEIEEGSNLNSFDNDSENPQTTNSLPEESSLGASAQKYEVEDNGFSPSDLNHMPLVSKCTSNSLEKNDLLGCVENLLRITMSAKNSESLIVEPSKFEFNNEASSASTINSDTPIYLNLIQLLMISHSPKSIEEFCEKVNLVVCLGEDFDCVQKRLVFFWKRVLWVIKTKFAPGEVEFSGNFLTEIENFLDEICEECDLAHLVKRIVTSVANSNSPCQWKTIFQKEDVLIETMGDDAGRAAYCKFIRRLHFSHSEESVHEFCDELSQAVCNESTAESDLKELLLVFWNGVLYLIENKLPLAGTEFNKNLLVEIRKTMPARINEFRLLHSMLDLLDDTFSGKGSENLCANIWKNIDGCRNQHSLLRIFQVDVMNHKPPNIESNRLDYYRFIQRLKFFNDKEEVQSFCDRLYDNIKGEKNTEIVHTLVTIFWIRVECSIRDDFDIWERPLGCHQTMFEKASKILDDTFKGDNCITKFSASHACCNCFCIQCAIWFHEWYYKKIFRNLFCLRKHCPNILDKCCTLPCFIIGAFFAIIVAVTIIFAFIYYFKVLILDWLSKL